MLKNTKFLFLLHITITILSILFFLFLTLKYKPIPVSDFEYYWDYTSNLNEYYKGGVLFVLYLPFKLLGFTPYISAFFVNSLCFLGISFTFWLGTKPKWQIISTFSLFLLGFWISGYAPIVNSDIPSIALYILSLKILLIYIKKQSLPFLILSTLMLSSSISMRNHLLFITIIILVFSLLIFSYRKLKKFTNLKSLTAFLVYLLLGIVFSMSVEFLLTKNSLNQEEITIHKRITFYSGLFESPNNQYFCGGWSTEARNKTIEEKNIDFRYMVIVNLKRLDIKKAISTISCKWYRYITFNDSSFYWLLSHLKNTTSYFLLPNLRFLEGIVAEIIKSLVTFLLFLTFLRKKFSKEDIFVVITSIIFLCGYFCLGTILEIQPRYIISPILYSLIALLYVHSGELHKILEK